MPTVTANIGNKNVNHIQCCNHCSVITFDTENDDKIQFA